MASQVNICNQALRLLGAEPITDINEQTAEAQSCLAFYEDAKKAVLEEFPWTFAQKRIDLAPSATDPVWGYDFRFKLPLDFISLQEIETPGDQDQWVIESDHLLTNREDTSIRYTADVTEGLMPGMFVKAFAAYLAHEVAGDLVESRTKVESLLQMYGGRLNTAQNNDGAQRSPQRVRTQNYLARARRTMGYRGAGSGTGVSSG